MQKNHIKPHPALQAPGEQFSQRWIGAADGFISSLYWALRYPRETASITAARAAHDAGLRLSREDFPTEETWNLTRLLCGFAEAGIVPTSEKIFRVAHRGGIDLPGGGGDPLAELLEILHAHASAVHLLHCGQQLQHFARKHRQVRRLWRVLRDLVEDEKPARRPAAQLRGRVVA